MTPIILRNNIDGDVVDKWLDMSQNLQDWTRTFRLAKNTLDSEDFATKEDIAAQKQSMKNARAYKTSRKERINDKFDQVSPKYYASF